MLNATNLNLPLETLTSLFFLFVVGAYVIFTGIFYYHWQAYATDKKVTTMTIGLYFLTTIPLLLVMGVTLLLM